MIKDYPSYLDYPIPRRTMTTADYIRAMSDVDLAKWLSGKRRVYLWKV